MALRPRLPRSDPPPAVTRDAPAWYDLDGLPVVIEFPPGGDHIQRQITGKGWYELAMLRDARTRLEHSRDGLVVDVGAWAGTHALYFALRCDQHVLALEPNVSSFVALRHNVQANGAGLLVTSVPLAAGREDGWGELVDGPAHNSGMARVVPGAGGVWIRRLDAILKAYEDESGNRLPVVLVKVDVEGSELDVLAGAVETLERHHPLLYVEAPESHDAVRDFLAEFGYEQFGVFNATPTYGFEAR